MGLAPISPLTGALPWATTAKGESGAVGGAVVEVAGAAAIGTATAVPYIGVAAFVAASIISYEILLVWYIQDNICMPNINAIMAVYISRYCIDIWITWWW